MQEQRDVYLISEMLLDQTNESELLEFKKNNTASETIGKLISALSNSARLAKKKSAFVVWGISNDKDLVGSDWDFANERQGNQGLKIWLSSMLRPCPHFEFRSVEFNSKRIVLLEISAASVSPVEFDKTAYIRLGDATPRLSDHPQKLVQLVEAIRPFRWENENAREFLSSDTVLELIDFPAFFRLTGQPLPDNRAGIFERLTADKILFEDVGDKWSISNLGAVLFANDLNLFDERISRKAVRFVQYEGNNRASSVVNRRDETLGYANGFEGLATYISSLIPTNEQIGLAFRKSSPMLPSLAIRELVANALIHQDMTVIGAGPMIELFSDRMEITNPGQPLVDPDRMIDMPPQSRNESLASLMRRMGLCEEQGSGLDKVIQEVELCQLSPPEFVASENAMRVALFGAKSYAEMSYDERVRACYQHSIIKYLSGERMRNKTLCARLGIDQKNAAQATGVINRTLEIGWIKPVEDGNPRAGYVPIWA